MAASAAIVIQRFMAVPSLAWCPAVMALAYLSSTGLYRTVQHRTGIRIRHQTLVLSGKGGGTDLHGSIVHPDDPSGRLADTGVVRGLAGPVAGRAHTAARLAPGPDARGAGAIAPPVAGHIRDVDDDVRIAVRLAVVRLVPDFELASPNGRVTDEGEHVRRREAGRCGRHPIERVAVAEDVGLAGAGPARGG